MRHGFKRLTLFQIRVSSVLSVFKIGFKTVSKVFSKSLVRFMSRDNLKSEIVYHISSIKKKKRSKIYFEGQQLKSHRHSHQKIPPCLRKKTCQIVNAIAFKAGVGVVRAGVIAVGAVAVRPGIRRIAGVE